MNVYYSTKSKDLYVTTITDFESYKYETKLIQQKVEKIDDCVIIFENYFCYSSNTIVLAPKKLSEHTKTIPQKKFVEESIVHERNLFD
jgi:hypothetical protein